MLQFWYFLIQQCDLVIFLIYLGVSLTNLKLKLHYLSVLVVVLFPQLSEILLWVNVHLWVLLIPDSTALDLYFESSIFHL